MGDEVSRRNAYGRHVYLDYVNFFPGGDETASWMLEILRSSVKECGVEEVHSHSEVFDGEKSPAGFASIVLIDESHVTAHCYSDKGWLALDAFTCGKHDPNQLANIIHEKLIGKCEGLKLMKRETVDRFVHDEL
jgi:S-adenosylmethionine decarboxylase|tara:strand:+ start:477 stop:878 length:402 start_codon:yes stop_codon:yes gene_type:complete